ncbi:hypothetical protein CsSME_00037599 [Camellia sinensis var. sinensis]
MHIPKRFWGDVVLTTTFLINRMPSRVLQFKTPLYTLSQYHSLPSLLNIPPKVFGCVCYIHVHHHQRGKMDPRALKCFLWVILLLRKGTGVIIPLLEKCMSLWMLPSLNKTYFLAGTSNTSLQGEIGSKEGEVVLGWNDNTNCVMIGDHTTNR